MGNATEDVNGRSLVIVGAWNPAIFTPQWAQEHIFPSDDRIDGEIALPEHVLRLTAGDMVLLVKPDRVEFRPKSVLEDNLARTERTAIRLLSRLQDTPVTAFGINFRFQVPDPSRTIDEILEVPEGERVRELGAAVESVSVKRRVIWEEFVVNVSVSRDGGIPPAISFNHHFPIVGALRCAEALHGTPSAAFDRTTRILGDVYDLQIKAIA
jgi:hypothetical protein